MRALRGVTISPSAKRYIYLVDGKKSPFLPLKRVKTNCEGPENDARISLLCDDKKRRESESLDYLCEYVLRLESDLRVTRAKDVARIYFFFAYTHTRTHPQAGPTISDGSQIAGASSATEGAGRYE